MRNGFVFSLIMALIVAIFAIQNAAAIPIKILFWEINFSLAIIILLSAVIGAVITGIMGIKKERGIKKQNKDISNKIEELEKTNADLLDRLEKLSSDSKNEHYIKEVDDKEIVLDNENKK
ncbi:LapA family protein [Clostridium sporogenes]|uniref:LapA family protein n=1 Tax=Clostridium sporogenes TaxID=1509 RepID=UPI0013D67F43|nr:LapA family protein [Clostridium sporogenes]MBU5298867.1 LapA family protein [Clostridium sporogenes]NFP93036.1 LapA family protein [Clostridium sporogenes]